MMKSIVRIVAASLLFGLGIARGQSRDTEIMPQVEEVKLPQQLAEPPCASRFCGGIGLVSLVTLLDRTIGEFESHGENALDSILRLGIENKIPLGMILTGNRLCTKVGLATQHQSAKAIIDSLVKQIGNYRWRIQDDLLVIEPQPVPTSAEQLLATKIPFFSFDVSAVEIEASLLMSTKAVIQPEEQSSVASIIRSPDESKKPAFQMEDATVEEILAHIVRQNGGGAWIVLPIPVDYKRAADRPFVKILYYSDNHAGEHISCEGLALHNPAS